MSEWQPIETAPRDGRVLRLGWLPNECLEFDAVSHWADGEWAGGWTPTHWQHRRGRKKFRLPAPPQED